MQRLLAFSGKNTRRRRLTSFSKSTASKDRFFQETRWEPNLAGEVILEVGSGEGRFTEHALSTGATVISIDYSDAVEVNYELNGHNNNLLLIQASIYEMPFHSRYFDRVFCFGVIQSTPNVKQSFLALVEQTKAGGQLVFDCYIRNEGLLGGIKQLLKTKYWARRFTRGIKGEKLYGMTVRHVTRLWPIVRLISRIPKLGSKLVRFMVVADNGYHLNLSDDKRREWAILDTYDWLSPVFDSPQTMTTVKSWLADAPLRNTEVDYGFNGLEARGIRE